MIRGLLTLFDFIDLLFVVGLWHWLLTIGFAGFICHQFDLFVDSGCIFDVSVRLPGVEVRRHSVIPRHRRGIPIHSCGRVPVERQ